MSAQRQICDQSLPKIISAPAAICHAITKKRKALAPFLIIVLNGTVSFALIQCTHKHKLKKVPPSSSGHKK